MIFTKKGSFAWFEQDGLTVRINYDSVMNEIDEEINSPTIFEIADEGVESVYYFNRKGVTKEDYIESLVGIKRLIEKIFTDVPSINIFDFIPVTKKGNFAKNRQIHLAVPVVGLFYNCDYYKYARYFCLNISVESEDEAVVKWMLLQSDVNKVDAIFFNNYETPNVIEKRSAIKKADLKVGMIYSNDTGKKFKIYLGRAEWYFGSVIKQSKVMLPISDFSEAEMKAVAEAKFKERLDNAEKYGIKGFSTYDYLYVDISKKTLDTYINNKDSFDFETFVREAFEKGRVFGYQKPQRVFREEYQLLKDIKPFEAFLKKETQLIDNTGACYFAELPREMHCICKFTYVNYFE